MMPMVFELITMLAVLGLGFVLGRIWEIRRNVCSMAIAKTQQEYTLAQTR